MRTQGRRFAHSYRSPHLLPPPIAGTAARRKSNTAEISAAYSSAAASVGVDTLTRSVRASAAQPVGARCAEPSHPRSPSTSQGSATKGRGHHGHAAAPEAAKPKARDIQRFLAIAANMVGDELEEGVTAAPVTAVAGRREVADAVLTRDQLKRATASKVMLAELRAEPDAK